MAVVVANRYAPYSGQRELVLEDLPALNHIKRLSCSSITSSAHFSSSIQRIILAEDEEAQRLYDQLVEVVETKRRRLGE